MGLTTAPIRPAPEERRPLIEEHSFDHIPETERHGKVRDQLYIWTGTNINVLSAATGVVGISMGLGFWWTLVAILIANIVGPIFMALHAAQGPRLGLPQMIQSRAQFGYYGALLIFVIVFWAYIGYAVFDVIIPAQAFQSLIGHSLTPYLIGITVVIMFLGLFGYDWIHFSMRWTTWIFTVVFLVATAILIGHGIPAQLLNQGSFKPGAFLLTISIMAVFQISYAPYVSDYSRYLAADRAKGAFWAVYLGTAISVIWMEVLGASLAVLAPQLSTISEIQALAGGNFGIVLALILAVGMIPGSALNIYGAIMMPLTIGNNFWTFRSTAKLRAVMAVFAAAIVYILATIGSGNFLNSFENFLTLLLYFLIPWTAINLTDYYLVQKGNYRTKDFFARHGAFGQLAWRGLFVYFLTFAIEIPFMNVTQFEGPIAKAMGGADIAWLVGLAVSIPLYYVLAKTAKPVSPQVDDAEAAEDAAAIRAGGATL